MNDWQFNGLTRSPDVEMTRRGLLRLTATATAAVGLALVGPAALAARAKTDQTPLADLEVLERGAAWLQSQQAADGGFLDIRGEANFGVTAEAVSALVALRNVGLEVEINAAVAYLQANAMEQVDQLLGGDGRVAVALVAAGGDPRDAGGVDLVDRIIASWDAGTGRYGANPIDNYFALLALAATGEAIPDEAIATLVATQLEDGAWNYLGTTEPGSGDATVTAFVVQALVAAGHGDDPMVAGAVAYLRTLQAANGAFEFSPGAPPDSIVTAFNISALTAAGEDLTGAEWNGAADALVAYQNESGAFRYTDEDPRDDIVATNVALLALAGGFLPVHPAA